MEEKQAQERILFNMSDMQAALVWRPCAIIVAFQDPILIEKSLFAYGKRENASISCTHAHCPGTSVLIQLVAKKMHLDTCGNEGDPPSFGFAY